VRETSGQTELRTSPVSLPDDPISQRNSAADPHGKRRSGGRLDDLYRIGVDEISYKRGRKFLTIVADHYSGHVVSVGSWPSSRSTNGKPNRVT
jgi:hypothetical protein